MQPGAGQGAPIYYQTRRPAEPHAGSTICLDKTYLLDTGEILMRSYFLWFIFAFFVLSLSPCLDKTCLLDTGGRWLFCALFFFLALFLWPLSPGQDPPP